MRKTLTDKGIAALKPRPKRYAYPDPELARALRPRHARGRQVVRHRHPLPGRQSGLDHARRHRPHDRRDRRARWHARRSTRVRAGMPAFESKGETFGDVVANWRKRHVERNGLRSRDEIVRLLERHILPPWHNREFISDPAQRYRRADGPDRGRERRAAGRLRLSTSCARS